MKKVCMYFQVHQPFRLKRYRFFSMGKDHFYFDDFMNRTIMQRISQECYLPMNRLLLQEIEAANSKLKVSFSITGTALEQFEEYAPEVLESFVELAKTGCVEFICETWNHSLAWLKSRAEFESQVIRHKTEIARYFDYNVTTFRNTELVYSDQIGDIVNSLGFETILAEGAKQTLGWKSPNFVYSNPLAQNQKVLMRNYKLSDDISFRFSNSDWAEHPLSSDKYIDWIVQEDGDVVNLFMDYETFGEHNRASTGIFEFFRCFVREGISTNRLEFTTPCEVARDCQSVAVLSVEHPTSWADEERDLSAWLGNELQDEAFSKLYSLRDKVVRLADNDLSYVFGSLQTSDHFYYMCTKWYSDGDVHSYFNPYDSPYDAFINYMNVLSDFELEVNKRL